MKVKEESEKPDFKLIIQKTKIMAFNPINSWQIDREKMETVTDFIFLGSKITAEGDWREEIERCFLLGSYEKPRQHIKKNRDITLQINVHIVKAIVLPVAMYGCERWSIKKAECRRINVFELWCCRIFLRVP